MASRSCTHSNKLHTSNRTVHQLNESFRFFRSPFPAAILIPDGRVCFPAASLRQTKFRQILPGSPCLNPGRSKNLLSLSESLSLIKRIPLPLPDNGDFKTALPLAELEFICRLSCSEGGYVVPDGPSGSFFRVLSIRPDRVLLLQH